MILAVLSRLHEAQYGYSLKQALGNAGMTIEEGTLYPLLRRLEGQGLLVSEWRTDSSPPRRYYRLSRDGAKTFERLREAWREQVRVMARLLSEETPK